MVAAPDARAAPRYYAALDGLRGYAACLVLLLHLMGAVLTEYFRVPESRISATSDVPGIAVMAFLAEGHHGVEIFFVLSGFLMARLVDTRRRWVDFYIRRIRRIYPAFIVSLACAAAVYCTAYAWEFKPYDFLLNLLFVNAWPGSGIVAYNHVSWTLGYEFAFYLTLPILAAFPRPRWRMGCAAVAAALLLAFAPPPLPRMAGLYAGFMLGCLPDAAIARRVGRVPTIAVVFVYAAFVSAKAVGWITVSVFFNLLPLLIVLVIARIAFDDGVIGRMFSSPLMTWLGRRSYSIYLWHPLVIAVVVYDMLPRSGLMAFPAWATTFVCAMSLLLTLAVAAASYRWVEMPFLRHRAVTARSLEAAAAPGETNCDAGIPPVKLQPPAARTIP
jgi:peptidoglycan/LPS O-acetylase OafA/YrhL